MRRTVIASCVLVALILLTPTLVQAQAMKTPFTATQTQTGSGMPERFWVDDDGVAHGRRHPFTFELTGDISGTASSTISWNIDLATGDGDLHGSVVLDVTWDGRSGTFVGRFSGTFTSWFSSWESVAHGTGVFEGMKMFRTGTPAGPGVWTVDGMILSPRG